jgi:hypothetical protein
MQNREITLKAKLVASYKDGMGYTSYVFQDLNFKDYDYQYIMCVRFPNWNNPPVSIGDVGFLTVKYVREGEDEWYNGSDFIKYNYTNIIFLKFIHNRPHTESIILD